MKRITTRQFFIALFAALALPGPAWSEGADMTAAHHPLAGTWTLVAADAIKPDGSAIRDYGDAPKGRLIVDERGRYSLQIFKSERPRFASGNKAVATAAEYEAAAMGSSTHYGEVAFTPDGKLMFSIEGSSFSNWEGTQQSRQYELKDDVLSYRVPARPGGDVPISVWKRVR